MEFAPESVSVSVTILCGENLIWVFNATWIF